MKKFFTIIVAICLLAGALCAAAFAAEPVMSVKYGSETKTFENFEDGWNFAMEEANDDKEVYVTLLSDWIADDGKFSDDFINGDGFDNDTIYFADDANVTLDLGGHIIDRGIGYEQFDGEVMFIDDDANVTIKNGTIKGGYSSNGAGGIHIEDANVKLIDLVITNNQVMTSNGSAIHHDGGELYMKNCRIVDNDGTKIGLDIYGAVYLDGLDKVLIEDCYFGDNEDIDYGAGIYADECDDFVIKNSTFENLHAGDRGGAIWVGGDDNKLYIYNCKFNGNSAGNWGGAIYTQMTEIYVYDTEFKGNYAEWDGGAIYFDGKTTVTLESHTVPSYFYRCTFDGNRAGWDGGAIYCNYGLFSSGAYMYGCELINNSAEENGGAIYAQNGCIFEFYSDEESGNAGTIKNNSAGILGGGVFQETSWNDIGASIVLGGEIYIKENFSSAGADDLYLEEPYDVYLESITSPKGSVGVRFENEKGGEWINYKDENVVMEPDVFFADNEGLELVIGERERHDSTGRHNVPCLKSVKKTAHVGSIFGEGSISTIIALLALIASGVSICMTVAQNKKKSAPAAAEDEE